MIVLSAATEEAGRIMDDAFQVAATQPGGTLATMHSEDGTPYLTYVLFHLRRNGEVLFGSSDKPQHARNLDATPESSFLIDNREVINSDADHFWRIVVEGWAELIGRDAKEYRDLLEELREKSEMAAYFTEHGRLYRLRPHRMVCMRGYEAGRHIIEFDAD
jgi:hypothetical protein